MFRSPPAAASRLLDHRQCRSRSRGAALATIHCRSACHPSLAANVKDRERLGGLRYVGPTPLAALGRCPTARARIRPAPDDALAERRLDRSADEAAEEAAAAVPLQLAITIASLSKGLGLTLGKGEEALKLVATRPGGAADEAGLRVGDRLLEVNGHEVSTSADVRKWLLPTQPNELLVERPHAEKAGGRQAKAGSLGLAEAEKAISAAKEAEARATTAEAERDEARQQMAEVREASTAATRRIAGLEAERDKFKHIARELKKQRDDLQRMTSRPASTTPFDAPQAARPARGGAAAGAVDASIRCGQSI